MTNFVIERMDPVYQSFDGKLSQNPYNQYSNKSDDTKFGRSLTKSDIEGASPKKFKHRPRKFFVDRNEVKGVFNQRPGIYHGFLNDIYTGGTFINERPDRVFKWSLTNKKDVEAMSSYKRGQNKSPHR